VGIKRAIRNAVCWLLAVIFRSLGYLKRARQASFQEGVITPVYGHNPGKKLFRQVVTWFKNNGYTFISCDQLLAILEKKIACPRGAVWLSLDDGWKENIDNVIPIAVAENIPVTIFIYTDAVEDGSFWWRHLRNYTELLPPEIRRTKAIMELPEDARKRILSLIAEAEPRSRSNREAMTIEDVRNIAAVSQVTIGAHTVTHPALFNCDDSQIDYELRESKRKLEEWTGKPVISFSYPFGRFDGRERQFLEQYGYHLAATTENRLSRLESDGYLFPRTDMMDDGSLTENLCHALGIWQPLASRIKQIFRRRG
jgi:peptidoglycan/xylan/chitin deacetylase (PgdA/CDA1 family)